MKRSAGFLYRVCQNQLLNPAFLSTTKSTGKKNNATWKLKGLNKKLLVGASVVGACVGTKLLLKSFDVDKFGTKNLEGGEEDALTVSCAEATYKDCVDVSREFFKRHCSATMESMTVDDMNGELRRVLKKATFGYGSPGRQNHTVVMSDLNTFFQELQETAITNKQYPFTVADEDAPVRNLITKSGYTVLLFTWNEKTKAYTCEQVEGVHLLISFARKGSGENSTWCPIHMESLMIAPLQRNESLKTHTTKNLPIYTVTPLGTPEILITKEETEPSPPLPEETKEADVAENSEQQSLLVVPSEPSSPGPSTSSSEIAPSTSTAPGDAKDSLHVPELSLPHESALDLPGPAEPKEKKLANPSPRKGKGKVAPPPSPKKGKKLEAAGGKVEEDSEKILYFVSPKREFQSLDKDGNFRVTLKEFEFYVVHEMNLARQRMIVVATENPREVTHLEPSEGAIWLVCSSCRHDLSKIFKNETTDNKKIRVVVTSEATQGIRKFENMKMLKPKVGEEGLVLGGLTDENREYVMIKIGKEYGVLKVIHITPVCAVCSNRGTILAKLLESAEMKARLVELSKLKEGKKFDEEEGDKK